MARRKPRRKPLGTIWEIPDELWIRIEPILNDFWLKDPTGRRHALWRKMLNGILFGMRSGCLWDQRFGPKITVYNWFQRWTAGGVLEKIWAVLVAECDELGGVQWEWPSADAMQVKSRFGGRKTGNKPTDRGKKGTKKNVLADGEGGPLGLVIAGVNAIERKLLRSTIEAIVVERPDPSETPQHQWLDKGDDSPTVKGRHSNRVITRTSGGSERR